MKKLLLVLLLVPTLFAATSAQQGMKIHDYPATTTVGTDDLFLLDYWNGTRYSTNKSISFTNFYNQVTSNLNLSVGKLSISSNLSDVANKVTSRSNLLSETRITVNVLDFGAVGDGITDDTAAVTAAYNSLSGINGGEITFPVGNWKFNLVVAKRNITISGVSHTVDFTNSLTSHFIPANTTLPVIQVGNNTGYVKGFLLRDVTLDGSATGDFGLSLAGGAFEATIQNVVIFNFKTCVKVLGGTIYPASLIYFNRLDVQPANLVGARGFHIVQTANYPTSWTTAIYLINSHVQGPASASNSYALETDSCGIQMSNTYFDGFDGHGIKISQNLAQLPHLYCSIVNFDSVPGTGAAIESFSNNRYFSDQISGTYTIAGKWKLLDTSLLTPPQGSTRQNSGNLLPWIFGNANFVGSDDTTFTGSNVTNHFMGVGNGLLSIYTTNSLRIKNGNGIVQLYNTGAADGNTYIRFNDDVNTKTADIHSLAGFIDLRPVNGGGTRLQSSAGNTWFQVNGTDGATFLFGASLGASKPFIYTDSNSQAKAGTTGLGITNTSTGILSNNIVAGANVTITAGASGQLTIASSGGGGGSAPVGTMVSNGSTFVAGTVPIATDTTGTNFTGTATITVTTTNASFKGTVFVDNLVATNGITLGTGGTNLSVTGNVLANGGVFTNILTIGGVNVSTATSTDTFQNKTFDSQATGNVLKLIDYKDFIYPHKIDGTGTIIVTNDYTSGASGLVKYNGTSGTNSNYAFFRAGIVPLDLDSSTVIILKNLGFFVSGTDTGSASFTIALFSPASSSVYTPSDFTACSTFILATTGTLTSPVANDQFYLPDTTLTGWAAGLTAGRPLIIGIARDGTDANNDSITLTGGTILYGRTQ